MTLSSPVNPSIPTMSSIYTGSPGLHIFEYADLVIGDKVIERLDGYSMALYFMKHYGPLYNDVFDDTLGGNPEQYFEYLPINGIKFCPTRNNKFAGPDVFNLTNENPLSNRSSGVMDFSNNRSIFYPLPFYFFNKPSLALPICLLHKQEIKLRLKLRTRKDMILYNKNITFKDIQTYPFAKNDITHLFTPCNIIDFSVPVEFAYISDDDYTFFSSKPCTYIINQIQSQVVHVESNVFNINSRLDFINPVKCIDFFVRYVRNDDYSNMYNMKANWARLSTGRARFHHIESIELEFDGETFLSNSVANYQFLTYVQKYKHNLGFYNFTISDMYRSFGGETYQIKPVIFSSYSGYNPVYAKFVSGPFYSYSFALDPLSEKPCGYMNFSTIRTPIIKINMFSDIINNTSLPRDIYIYANTINILTFDPKKGNATLMFQNPTYT